MKRKYILSAILAFFSLSPICALCQDDNYQNIPLTNLDGKQVSMVEVIDDQTPTQVIFWNSNDKKHIDYLDTLDERMDANPGESPFHVVAICTDRFHNYQKLQIMVAAKGWDFDFYLDVNESFMYNYGLSEEYLQSIIIDSYEESRQSLIDKKELTAPFVGQDADRFLPGI